MITFFLNCFRHRYAESLGCIQLFTCRLLVFIRRKRIFLGGYIFIRIESFPLNIFNNYLFIYLFQASTADGDIIIVFDTDEWKYTTHTVYMSLFGLSTHPLIKPKIVADAMEMTMTAWSRDETYSMKETDIRTYTIFKSIFSDIDGSSVSQTDRAENRNADDQGFTYGEVEFPSFIEILRAANARDGQIFVDLGCGAGKALISAALSETQFIRCTGIEYLPGLAQCAKAAVSSLTKRLDAIAQVHHESELSRKMPLLEIRTGDILDTDWSDADLVYMSSICFPEQLIQKIFERASRLKAGSTIVTLKIIPGFEQYFELKAERWFKMSWGSILVYILVVRKPTSESFKKNSALKL